MCVIKYICVWLSVYVVECVCVWCEYYVTRMYVYIYIYREREIACEYILTFCGSKLKPLFNSGWTFSN